MPLLLAAIDWHGMFVPSMSLVEIFLRGSFIYLSINLLFRILPREAGSFGISDLLVVVLIADASQNAMAGSYQSITEGLVLILTIVGWDLLFDWLCVQYPGLTAYLRPPPLLLIDRGVIQRKNLRRELVSEDELMGQLRQQGIDDVQLVKKCYLEVNGQISVIRMESDRESGSRPNDKHPA